MKTVTMYRHSMLWTPPGKANDPSTWIDPSAWHRNYRGPHMNPNTKTGQMNIIFAIDARTNHNMLRTNETMVRFYEEVAARVGMQNPGKVARAYFKSHLNERFLVEVTVTVDDKQQVVA